LFEAPDILIPAPLGQYGTGVPFDIEYVNDPNPAVVVKVTPSVPESAVEPTPDN
jgi:hypothetical protein